MQIRMVEGHVVVLSPCWLHCLVWLCAWLCQAGIQLWVLTGDKLETARNIGFSTKLLSDAMDWEGRWHEWQKHDLSEDLINIWRIHHRYPWVYRSDIIFFYQPWFQVFLQLGAGCDSGVVTERFLCVSVWSYKMFSNMILWYYVYMILYVIYIYMWVFPKIMVPPNNPF